MRECLIPHIRRDPSLKGLRWTLLKYRYRQSAEAHADLEALINQARSAPFAGLLSVAFPALPLNTPPSRGRDGAMVGGGTGAPMTAVTMTFEMTRDCLAGSATGESARQALTRTSQRSGE